MNQNIKVSVILPVYNVESCLGECMDTLLGQSLKEIEIICIDDGSTDNSLAILEEKAAKDKRVRVLKQKNSGAAAARNHGFTYAAGEYVLFLDSDDFYKKDMLKKSYECAKREQTDIVIFRCEEYDTVKKHYNPMEYSVKKEELPDKNPFTYHDIPDYIFTFAVGWAWDKLYKREFIVNSGLQFQELRTSNDLYFVFSSLVKANGIYILDEPLIYHRVNRGTSLSVTREKSWDCFYKALTALKDELVKMNIYEEVERGFLNWVIHFAFWNLDTITGKAYKNVYLLMKETLFIELGMEQKPEEFYLKRRYYERMHEVLETDFEDYVLFHMIEYRAKMKELKEVKSELAYVKNSTTFKVGKAVMKAPIKMKKIIKGEK